MFDAIGTLLLIIGLLWLAFLFFGFMKVVYDQAKAKESRKKALLYLLWAIIIIILGILGMGDRYVRF